ncbi:MAG: F0F1 ATP synthase subunit alpha [Patescibacteria group bacterium]
MDSKQTTKHDTEVGYVVNTRDFLVYLDGFPSVHINDLVESESGPRGWITSLSKDLVEVLMLDEGKVKPHDAFHLLPDALGLAVGEFLLGRAINPVGVPIDGKGQLQKTKDVKIYPLDKPAPGIEAREFINEQFLTGITTVDSLIPIGKGQRELILGDAHSGKTQFLLDVIVNQKGSNVICVYASIGKSAVSVRNLIDSLRANNALAYTIIVAASSSESAPLIFLTPKTAFTVAEYFQKQGKEVLLILDDLLIHAKIHREISLLSQRPPGKESYPGDTFHQHASLIERAGNFSKEAGSGSITALPVAELNLSDFTTLIPTNLMAMTDGHLLFKSSLYAQGQRPSIDISLSVSRVGRQTQDRLSNLLSTKIRLLLAEAADLETIARFSSELPAQTRLTLLQKELIMEIIKQDPLTAIPKKIQLLLLSLPFTTFLQDKNKAFIEKYKKVLIEAFLKDPTLSKIGKGMDKIKTEEELIKILEGAGGVLTKICQ